LVKSVESIQSQKAGCFFYGDRSNNISMLIHEHFDQTAPRSNMDATYLSRYYEFDIHKSSFLALEQFDLLGEMVGTVFAEDLQAGPYKIL
jgi:hypothetical protein